MTVTPWGNSQSLRDRMLRPGPGSHNDEVERNQRERVFGAMVAKVSEHGYTATKISDLVELSGVSSRTFYDLFGDKQTCFSETIQAVLGLAVATIEEVDRAQRGRGWEARALASLQAFAEMVARQPAAAQVCLIDAFAAGPVAVKPLEDATAAFERVAQEIVLDSPERVGMPPEMMTVHVGALLEIARKRLREGTTAELPQLMKEVAEVMFSYQPPPEPLRLNTRSPAPRPEDLEAHNHAERAVRAFGVVVAGKGYAGTTIDEVIACASMSATTFYANFSGKEDVLMSAIDSAGAQVVAAALPAFERSLDWPSGVRDSYGAMLSFLATRPALAHLMAVGVYGAGLPAMQRRADALAPLRALIEGGGRNQPLQPLPIALEVIVGAAYGLIYRQVRESGPESLPALAPICTYLTLAPFLGAEEAAKAANGDGRRRRGLTWPKGKPGQPPQRPVGERILEYVALRSAGAVELASYLGEPPEIIAAELARLRRAGAVDVFSQPGPEGRVEENFSSPNMGEISTTDWERLEPDQRSRISARILQLIGANTDLAIETGTFDARTDRHLSHFALRLDEQGWAEAEAHLDAAFNAVREVEARSHARQLEAGDGGIEARVALALFEVPADRSSEEA
jgi:AcrR family transcriptional regulator